MGRHVAEEECRTMLAKMSTPVRTLGTSRVKPSVYFMPIDSPTSSRPATSSRIQAMRGTSVSDQQGCVVFAWERVRAPPGTGRLDGVLPTPSTVAKHTQKGLVTMVTSPVSSATPYKYKPVESSEPSKRSAATACR